MEEHATIKMYLAEHHPEVKSITLEVREVCLDDHPPKSITWTIDQSSNLMQRARLYWGRYPQQTSEFDAGFEVTKYLKHLKYAENFDKEKWRRLPSYHTDASKTEHSKTVTRSCKVTVVYRDGVATRNFGLPPAA
jgi:hypothetical protein